MFENAPNVLSGVTSSRHACALICLLCLGAFAAEVKGKPACLDDVRTGLCTVKEIQTDPAPFVIGAFGGEQFPAPEGVLWEKWRTVEAEIAKDAKRMVRCRVQIDCPWPVVEVFASIVRGAVKLQGLQRLEYANRAVNSAIEFMEDAEAFGVPDYWQAPISAIQNGYGDCEDYAIAKFAALRLAGMPADDRQLVIVRDVKKHREHMVVGVRHDDQWFILDNNTMQIKKDSDLPHYIPKFAIDDRGLRQYGLPSPPGGFLIHDLLVSTCASPVV